MPSADAGEGGLEALTRRTINITHTHFERTFAVLAEHGFTPNDLAVVSIALACQPLIVASEVGGERVDGQIMDTMELLAHELHVAAERNKVRLRQLET